MKYAVGEAAKKVGVNTSTLRYYEKEGLLPNIQRDKNGLRIFSENDLNLLKIINCLKETGMPLRDIKKFIDLSRLGDESIEERMEIFNCRRQEILNQIDELNKNLAIIDYKCWYYEEAKRQGGINKIDYTNMSDKAKAGKKILDEK